MKYGFITVAAAVPSVKVADTEYNVKQIEDFVAQAEGKGVEIVVFPELSVTGYSCQDLFLQQLLVEQAEVAVMQLLIIIQLCSCNSAWRYNWHDSENLPSELWRVL